MTTLAEWETLATQACDKMDELYDERRKLQTVLAAIVDCYGCGLTTDQFCAQVHDFIMEGRELVKDFKRD